MPVIPGIPEEDIGGSRFETTLGKVGDTPSEKQTKSKKGKKNWGMAQVAEVLKM
jgi:hypothetical protein